MILTVKDMTQQKTAFTAIVGRANVGKSSLLNAILGQKIAAVSSKPQTTRTRIMGVHTSGDDQLVFIDTPGFHKPHNMLGEKMVKAVTTGMQDVDAVILVVDAAPKFAFNPEQLPQAELQLIEGIKKRKVPAVLVVNKIDLLEDKQELLSIISAYTRHCDFDAVVPVSALKKDGVDILLKEVIKYTKPSPHYFADGDVTDQPEQTLVSEMIREKLLRNLEKEIPHGIAVDIERFFERDKKNGEPIVEVHAVIYCERESHKGVVIGKNGAMLKKVGEQARYDIERFFGCSCSLKLWVKVKENWRNSASLIRSFGLNGE